MMDNSKEGLMLFNKKSSFLSSFDPITEQQEEMSASSNIKNSQMKSKISNINIEENNTTKKVLDYKEIIKKAQTQKNIKSFFIKNYKDLLAKEDNKNEEDDEDNVKNSLSKHKKRIGKRNSVQEREKGNGLSSVSLLQLNNSEIREKCKKGSLGKQVHFFLGASFNNSYLHHSKSFLNQEYSVTKNNSNTKSLSNLFIDFNKASKKHTILHKGQLNFHQKSNNSSILDQIKNTKLYEKSEKLLFKLKICFGALAVFSLISIILNCADSILYNNKSLEFIHKENNNTIFDKNNINNYYCIKKRKISQKENNIRITNAIFSLFCFLVIIIIYKIKIGAFDNMKKNTKKEKFKRMLKQYYDKQKKD